MGRRNMEDHRVYMPQNSIHPLLMIMASKTPRPLETKWIRMSARVFAAIRETNTTSATHNRNGVDGCAATAYKQSAATELHETDTMPKHQVLQSCTSKLHMQAGCC